MAADETDEHLTTWRYGAGDAALPMNQDIFDLVGRNAEPIEIVDLRLDPQWCHTAWATNPPGIRCLYGAPLRAGPSTRLVGVLCAVGRQAKQLSDREQRGLAAVTGKLAERLDDRWRVGAPRRIGTPATHSRMRRNPAGYPQHHRGIEMTIVPPASLAPTGPPRYSPPPGVVAELAPEPAVVASVLSPRQQEILRLVASGSTNKAIASTLHLSLNTVRNYVQAVLTTLGVHTKLEAVLIGIREGIIELPSTSAGTAARPDVAVEGSR